MGPVEILTHSTVRIESLLSCGGISTGTGFYMELLRKNGNCIPVVITNKHVINDAVTGRIHVTLAKPDGEPDLGKKVVYEIHNFEAECIKHPDQSIDLAAFSISPLQIQAEQNGVKLFYQSLTTDLIPSPADRKALSPMEDIIMIGYPNGIWDSVHNMPVIRKGITATHPFIPWNGKREFLTDIACFPGSSGSPVFLCNIGTFSDNFGTIKAGVRINLLGILYAGTLHNAPGKFNQSTIPPTNSPTTTTQIPNNIGIVINSEEIYGLEKAIEQFMTTA